MDRVIAYSGAIPQSSDINKAQRSSMIALGYLAQAVLGTSPVADGFACVPLAAGVGVSIGLGSVASLQVVDGGAVGSLSADPLTPVVKLAINTQSTQMALSVPQTPGQSVSYLVQGAFLEAQDGPVVLPYYNAANPAQPWSGPGGQGAAQNTVITQRVSLQLKAGVPAASGTQTAPAADYGYIPLWVVTVSAGQTSVNAGNIVPAPGAPFITTKLPGAAPLVSPALTGYPTAPTPVAGDKSALLATTAFVQTAVSSVKIGTKQIGVINTPGSGTFTVPAGVFTLNVEVGGGGGGGGSGNATNTGAGGGAGGFARGPMAVTPGQTFNYIVGAGGASVSNGSQGGNGGSTSFGGIFSATGGTGGAGGNSSSPAGGQGGVGSGPGLLQPGGSGSDGCTGNQYFGGNGGGSYYGGGGRAGTNGGFSGAFASGGGGTYLNPGVGSGVGGGGIIVLEYTQVGG
jgi:hypothetical protein